RVSLASARCGATLVAAPGRRLSHPVDGTTCLHTPIVKVLVAAAAGTDRATRERQWRSLPRQEALRAQFARRTAAGRTRDNRDCVVRIGNVVVGVVIRVAPLGFLASEQAA